MPARTPRSELLKIHNPLLARLETGDGEGLQLPPSSHLTGPLTRPLTTAYGCWIQLFTVCRVRWCVVYPERGQRDAWQLCPLPLQFVAWPAVAGNRKQNKEIAEIVVCLAAAAATAAAAAPPLTTLTSTPTLRRQCLVNQCRMSHTVSTLPGLPQCRPRHVITIITAMIHRVTLSSPRMQQKLSLGKERIPLPHSCLVAK